MQPQKASETISSLGRGLEVLSLLEKGGGVSLANLHRATGFSKSSLVRILNTLAEHGFIRRRGDGTWWLCWRAGRNAAAQRKMLLADRALELLPALTKLIGWPIDVFVYDRGMMELIETTRDNLNFEVVSVGHRVPVLASAVGRCWLGLCSDEERAQALEWMRRSTSGYDRPAHNDEYCERLVETVRAEGHATRIRGYHSAITRPGNSNMAMAVPVLTSAGIAACLNVVWDTRFAAIPDFAEKWLSTLQDAASRLGQRIADDV